MSRESIEHVRIPVSDAILEGDLVTPPGATAIVVFAHGSGSSRFSPRNRFVAEAIREHRLATLLFDLLTPDEERIDRYTGHLRFDIKMLAGRLISVISWLRSRPEFARIGLFGASTGAAAALIAAARSGDAVRTVVSRGGRPDLADSDLSKVRCPVLLIVGGDDDLVIRLNEQASAKLRCERRIEIIPGATHLFEEPGKLDEVAAIAGQWFEDQLAVSSKAVCT